MAHTYDTKAQFTTGSADPTDLSYTCGSGATLLVLLIVGAGTTLRTGGAPTYNGVAMTAGDTHYNVETFCELWYMLNPPTGAAYTIRIQNDNARTIFGCAASFIASAGSSALRTCSKTSDTVANPAGPTMTSLAAGDVLVAVVGTGDNTFAPSAQTGTSLYVYDPAAYGMGSQYYIAPDTGDRQLSWTEATADDWQVICASFKEVADKSAALNNTNAGGTGAVGTLALALAMAISGTSVLGTGQVGSPASPNIAVALTGNAAVSAVGNVSYGGSCSVGDMTPSGAAALTGEAGTGNVGTVIYSVGGIDVPINNTDAGGTGALGTMPPMMEVVLAGIQALGEVGTVGYVPWTDIQVPITGVSANPAYPITSVEATGAVGSVAVSGDLAISLTGVSANPAYPISSVAAAGEVGTIVYATQFTNIALTGVATASSVGSVTAPDTTGAAMTGHVGSVGLNTAPMPSDVSVIIDVGTLTPIRSVAIAGLSASGGVGSVGVVKIYPPDVNVYIGGVAGSGVVGTVGVTKSVGDVSVALSGVSGSGDVGTVILVVSPNDIYVAISGVSGSVAVGPVGVVQTFFGDIEIPLTSQALAGIAGVAAPVLTRALTGNSATGVVNSIPPYAGVPLPICVIPFEDPLPGGDPTLEAPLAAGDPEKEVPWNCQ